MISFNVSQKNLDQINKKCEKPKKDKRKRKEINVQDMWDIIER